MDTEPCSQRLQSRKETLSKHASHGNTFTRLRSQAEEDGGGKRYQKASSPTIDA